jgi:hypothetical protein
VAVELTMPQKIEECKRCSQCGIVKPIWEFGYYTNSPDGRRNKCKECRRHEARARYLANPERVAYISGKWAREHPEMVKVIKAKYCRAHKEQWRESGRKYRLANPDKVRARHKLYDETHKEQRRALDKRLRLARKEHYLEIARRSLAKQRATPQGKLNHRISSAINQALKGNKNGWHWETLTGYTLDQLKQHLEKQFLSGMSWENMGKWHIHHETPKSVFNYQTQDDLDFKRCWALSNLRPLWSFDNKSKHNKLDKPFQPALALRVA